MLFLGLPSLIFVNVMMKFPVSAAAVLTFVAVFQLGRKAKSLWCTRSKTEKKIRCKRVVKYCACDHS